MSNPRNSYDDERGRLDSTNKTIRLRELSNGKLVRIHFKIKSTSLTTIDINNRTGNMCIDEPTHLVIVG